jgi:hypothetical protein
MPLIRKIWSPERMPALAAGVSSIAVTTVGRPFFIETSMPRPLKRLRVSSCMSRKSLGSMNWLCGSSDESIPFIAALTRS